MVKKVVKHITIVVAMLAVVLCIGNVSGIISNTTVEAKNRSITIFVDETKKTTPKKAKKVSVTCSNEKIVTVKKEKIKGKFVVSIKGKSAGKAKVTMKADKEKAQVINVTVEKPEMSNINLSLVVGNSAKLEVTGTKRKPKWSSSDESKATVENNGKVTAKSEGKVTITASFPNSSRTLTCKIEVLPSIGDINNPRTPFEEYETTVYEGDENLGIFKITLLEYKEGNDVIDLMKESKKEYIEPNSNQKYVFMKFSLKYISGKYGISANRVINFNENLYDSKKITPLGNSFCVKEVATRDIDDVLLYQGGMSAFSKTILVDNDVTPLAYKIQTGYDGITNQPVYTWFTIKNK